MYTMAKWCSGTNDFGPHKEWLNNKLHPILISNALKTRAVRTAKHLFLSLSLVLFTARAVVADAATPSSESGPQLPKARISVRPLDLSRVPATEELMAAGQLGGILYPTAPSLADPKRDEAARLDFGKAIDDWNKHDYTNAVELFKKHVRQFPDSPWADEATLHVGCDATYNGNYPLAEAVFGELITKNQGKPDLGGKMMWSKATQRLALVKVEENNLDEANKLFLDLKQNSSDFQLRTYAAHWLQRLSGYSAAKEALLNCGAVALAYVLEKDGHTTAASTVRKQIPKTMHGHSMADLISLAADQGYEASARHLETADLSKVPLPCVLHINQGSTGDKGHYWVLDKVAGDNVELFDPQSRRRFHQTIDQLAAQWSGNVLIFANGNQLPGRALDVSELEDSLGGCCGAPAAPSNQGNPGRNGAGGAGANGSPCGAPTWSVNMINMNFYMTDTPMWYDSAIGPSVHISLSYNSQSSISHYEPFGNKWTFSYGGYLIMDTSGAITVFMPDGEMDTYTPNGSGGYTRPYRVYNTLVQIGPNHFQLQFPDGTVYVYQIPVGTTSQQPFLTEIDDAYGEKLTLGYNSSVQLTTISDAQQHVFTLSYSASGLVTNVADPFGRNASFQYDGNNNLEQITDMGGYSSSLTYDTNSFVTSLSDERGTTSFYTELPGPAGDNSNNYPPPGDPDMFGCYRITVTDASGGREEFFYYGGCDIDGYGGCGGYSWYVSPRDYIPWQSQTINNYRSEAPKIRYLPTRVGSGQQGEIAEVLYPQGDYLQYSYDSVTGDRLSITDSHNYVWRYSYNLLGLPTSIMDGRGTMTTLNYAANNFDLLSISNGLGVITMTYNGQHSLVSITDQLTNTSSIYYNSYGQSVYQVDALGVTNQNLYDSNNRLSTILRSAQPILNLTYDNIGRVKTSADATGLLLTSSYDNLNRLVTLTYPDSKFDTYVYSTCCPHLIDRIIDRSGRAYNFTYDSLKRLVQVVNPEGGAVQIKYDANGNRTNVVDPNGNSTTLAYDTDNRLIRKTYSDSNYIAYAYDQGGFLSSRTNARGIVARYGLDANQNVLNISYSDGTPGITNVYDSFNRLISSIDATGTNSYGYDARSRLINFNGGWVNNAIVYGYDNLSRLTNMSAAGSQVVTYGYDAWNHLNSVAVGQRAYNYTFVGPNPLVQSLVRPNGSYTTYGYDSINRLTQLVNRFSSGQPVNSFAYSYNSQDLRDSETVSNVAVGTVSASQLVTNQFNGLNQPVQSSGPNSGFRFDADGNMVQGYTPSGMTFAASFDAENRLKTLVYTNGSGVAYSNVYLYRGNNFLAEIKQFQGGVLSDDTRLVRSGFTVVQERDSNNNVIRDYSWGLNVGGGIAGLLDLAQNGSSYSYIYDGKGNVSALLDDAQSVVQAYAYDPFGVAISSIGSVNQPFQYSTKRFDSQTGLVDFGYRNYNPAAGRWMTRDPLGESSSMNLYTYAANDPVLYNDLFGLTVIYIGGKGEAHAGAGFDVSGGIVIDPTHHLWGFRLCGGAGFGAGAALIFGEQNVERGDLTPGLSGSISDQVSGEAAFGKGVGGSIGIGGELTGNPPGGGASSGCANGNGSPVKYTTDWTGSAGLRTGLGADASIGAEGCVTYTFGGSN